MTDPIADFLTRMRNAQMVNRAEISVPFSKLKLAIAETMKKNRFVADVSTDKSGKFPKLVVKFAEKKLSLKRVSKPGQRIYKSSESLRKVKNGFGCLIVSTPLGVMTGYEARAKNVGGEVLCEVS